MHMNELNSPFLNIQKKKKRPRTTLYTHTYKYQLDYLTNVLAS